MSPVYVAGAGMTKFGRSEWSLMKLASDRPNFVIPAPAT